MRFSCVSTLSLSQPLQKSELVPVAGCASRHGPVLVMFGEFKAWLEFIALLDQLLRRTLYKPQQVCFRNQQSSIAWGKQHDSDSHGNIKNNTVRIPDNPSCCSSFNPSLLSSVLRLNRCRFSWVPWGPCCNSSLCSAKARCNWGGQCGTDPGSRDECLLNATHSRVARVASRSSRMFKDAQGCSRCGFSSKKLALQL